MEYTHLTEALTEIGEAMKEKYKNKLKANGVYATGKLYNSVGYRVTVTEDVINLEFEAEGYWINIEEGRKPNGKMPPINEIKRWMVSRGIPAKPGLDFLISRSIAKKGIKPKPFLRETKVELKELTPNLIKALKKDTDEFMEKRIKNKVKEQIKN